MAVGEHKEGCILAVRAQPGARRNAVMAEHGGALKIAVTAPPDQGKANKAILEILCQALEIKRNQVELLGGHTSRDKRFLIRGISAGDLRKRLQDFFRD